MIKRDGRTGFQPFWNPATLRERARGSELQQIKMIIAARTIDQRRHHVQVPRDRAEYQLLTGSQVHDDLGAFGRGEQQPAYPRWRGQKPRIGCNEREIPIISEGQMVNARGRGVEDAKPDPAGADRQVRVIRSVHQDFVAQQSCHCSTAL
jgi:hypothetical protein